MGALLSNFDQMLPPRPSWSVEDIPDQRGKVIIVTGGNSGIGKETVKALLVKNAKVYIATRSKERCTAAIRELKEQTGKEAVFLPLDLANLRSVEAAAKEFLSKERHLHVLFNNAGLKDCPMEQLTAQGFDMVFGVNVIGHWYFTELLLPALLAVSEDNPGQNSRVITTSSFAAYMNTIHWESIKDGPVRRSMTLDDFYDQSKHANIIVSNEVARRYGDKGIVAISVNPGNILTEMAKSNLTWWHRILLWPILYSPPFGALTQLRAGTDPSVATYNGAFMIPWARIGKAPPQTDDPAVGKKLWDWLENHARIGVA
ncbi:NAD(P)-binding protein [Irpex lacteus]|nr:NAD(P)-binding protein [Irpex lacteus]